MKNTSLKIIVLFFVAIASISLVHVTLAQTTFQITFNAQTIGSDFSGPVLNVDGTNYTQANLPVTLSLAEGSTHTYTYYGALYGNSSQYIWNSTVGLATTESGSLTVTSSGSITGEYTSYYVVDFTHDGTVNGNDFFYFAYAYIAYNQNGVYNPACDLNHDGKITTADFFLYLDDLIAYWQAQ